MGYTFMSKASAQRDDGFYWVSDAGCEPEVALWHAGSWWLAGSDEPAVETIITVLGERLVSSRSTVEVWEGQTAHALPSSD